MLRLGRDIRLKRIARTYSSPTGLLAQVEAVRVVSHCETVCIASTLPAMGRNRAMIVIHVDRGLDRPYARAYHGHVDRRYRLSHVDSEYACGRYPPNYPPPATIENVERACNYMFLSTCPYGPSPCLVCIEKFIDSIEIDYLDLD